MTIPSPGRAPQTDAELARSFHDRLRRLEQARTVRVGSWVLYEDGGNLFASRPGDIVQIDGTEVVEPTVQQITGPPIPKDELPTPGGGGLPGLGEIAESIFSTLYEALIGVGTAPVNALRQLADFLRLELSGLIDPSRIPVLPLRHIRDVEPNLLIDGDFTHPSTLDGLPDWQHDADDGYGTPPGCAVVTADGARHTIHSVNIEVADGDQLTIEARTKWVGLVAASGSNAIRLDVAAYRTDGSLIGGAPQTIAAVESPSGDSGGTDGWGTLLAYTYTPPTDAQYVVVEFTVTEAATAGVVKFDKAVARKVADFPQSYVAGLLDDLTSLWNGLGSLVDQLLIRLGIPPVGDLLDRIFDLSDELEWIQEQAAEGAQGAAQALSDVAGLAFNLLTDPASVIGTIPQSLVGGLTDLATQTNQILEILAGAVVTPINGLVQAVQDWFNQWFGGGSSTAIPMSMRGAANGVAPLGPNSKIPAMYLPEGSGGAEVSHPHFLLTLGADQPVPSATETTLSGWEVIGSTAPIFEDSSNTRWRFDGAGWWHVDTVISWQDSASGTRQSSLTRTLADASMLSEQIDSAPATSGLWTLRSNTSGLVDVSPTGVLEADDKFDVRVWQNSGATLNVLSESTYVRAVYLGDRMVDQDVGGPVEYDNRGVDWQHHAEGPNLAIVVLLSWNSTTTIPQVFYGNTAVQLASHVVGNGWSAGAFVLLDAAPGTHDIQVSTSSSYIGNSLSYTGVGGFTGGYTAQGNGAASMTVPSEPDRRVVNMFQQTGDRGSPSWLFTGYNQTERFSINPSLPGRSGRAGDAPGAASVTFSAPVGGGSVHWLGVAVDLHTL